MNSLDDVSRQFVLKLIGEAQDLTLATVRPDGYPHATTVSFANDGLTLYVGIGLDSQKAHNIRQNDKVSLTINVGYSDWNHIRGLSMGGRAALVSEPAEMQRASTCILSRFPQLKSILTGTDLIPWTGMIFLRITPEIISILDYEKGFGHTELFAIA